MSIRPIFRQVANGLRLRSTLWVCPFRGTGGRDWSPSRCFPGTRERHFGGTSFKPHKLPKNAHAKRPSRQSWWLSQGSGAPWNDGKQSFTTKERLTNWTIRVLRMPIFREKDAFQAASWCHSEKYYWHAFGLQAVVFRRFNFCHF